ncbi:uncharacterized protein LOC119767812 [Culex quinquefasciatus]|uniref:uncharacterized protein LOC119767812 n=1 Tax=Culex quinquefasciatus TaxID=7176 RepID=UPI0018E2A65C|nr:uncharacterized protein LOC119767812 [Culex quinquefasciatus]XP_038113304.1 uncharacterized protein LOC119767812 [Culex quinquefasciatus]
MEKMRRRVNFSFIIGIWLVLVGIQSSQSENAEPRALDLSVPWRPIPYHVPQQQLISVASFDTTSKDELVHIAQHNAQILKHYNQPITQYHNQNNLQVQHAGPKHQMQQQQQPGQTPGPKYMTTPLLLTNVSPGGAGAMQTQSRHAGKPFGVKSDQITTLNIVHSSTPKIVTPIGGGAGGSNVPVGHLSPPGGGGGGVKAGKFNGQFRDSVLNAGPGNHQKSTMKPHPVMNKLQAHMAGVQGFRGPKQPIAATSNRLEHYVTPNHLYGTYIQFGQASNPLQSAKTKFISQLASHPSFDAQLKGLLHAGVNGGYQQTFTHIKNLQKMNFMQQQNKLQNYFNHLPADVDLPKKLLSSAEKDANKFTVTPSTPLFPHIPPSVLTPFFQQVQQQQQNKFGFSLKTQHPAPPAASPSPTIHGFKEKPYKHHQQQPQLQYDSHQVHPTQYQGFKESQGHDSFGFTSYQSYQQPPFESKPHETVKFKDVKHNNGFNEIHDEYSKNLVPPPPSTQQAFLPTIINHPDPSKDPIEILNKYNINPHSPLQDANRFSYESFARPSASSHTPSSTPTSTSTSTSTHYPSTTTQRAPFYSHTITFNGDHNNYNTPVLVTPTNDDWIGRDKFITTEKPNVFKHLFRTTESEYKQHKLMHPSYTGLPPNKRPSPTTPVSIFDSSTEEPLITHSFFTIEDAISDPTLLPPPNNRNRYKYTTEAEENRLDEPQPEIVTIGPQFVDSQEFGTTTVYPMFKSKGRRRRPKPQSTTEASTDADITENPRLTNRYRTRTRPTTESDSEVKTTLAPPTSYLAEESSLKKLRKKLPPNFNRNRLTSATRDDFSSDQDRVNNDQLEPSVTQIPPTISVTTTTTTTSSPLFASDNNQLLNGGGNGLRSRFRPAGGEQQQKPTRTKPKAPTSDDLDLDPFRSTEVTRESENTRVNFKLANTKPSLRLPSSSFTYSTSSTSASFTSDESSAEMNRTRPEQNRPRFSIKEYRNKLNRTTTTTPTSIVTSDVEITTQPGTKLRFPTRNRFLLNNRPNKTTDSNEVLSSPPSGSSSTTEKPVNSESTTVRTSFRPTGTRSSYNNRFTVKKATTESSLAGQQPPVSTTTSRIVNRGRIRLQDTTTQSTPNRTANPSVLNTSTLANRRPSKISLRQRIQNHNRKKDSELREVDADGNSLLPGASSDETKGPADDLIGAINTQNAYDDTPAVAAGPVPSSTEGYRHPETAIMKISPKDSASNSYNDGDWDLNSASSDYSKRVVELTLSASKDKGFKSVNKGLLSRRVPGYFTLATEDPILPIEAFFPQVKKVGA